VDQFIIIIRTSLNLFALSDAQYQFIIIDIGVEGRQSDGRVFRNSKLYAALEENSLQIPSAEIVNIASPIIICDRSSTDEAFALKTHLMRPYLRNQKLN